MDAQLPVKPELVLGLTPLALQQALDHLKSQDKATLLRTCKQLRSIVLQQQPHLNFAVGNDQTADKLCELVHTRIQPLHLSLCLENASLAACFMMVALLSTHQTYPSKSGHACVTELDVQLPFHPQVRAQ